MRRSSTVRVDEHEDDEDLDVDLTKLTLDRTRSGGNKLRIGLASLRAVKGRSQVEMAERIGVTQAQVSKVEAGEDWKLSTLRRYAEALGGQLEVTVALDGRRYRIA